MNYDIQRTLAIVQQLARGMRLEIPEVGTIGMGEDMSIGFIYGVEGEERVPGLATMDLKELNQLLNDADIGMPLPFR